MSDTKEILDARFEHRDRGNYTEWVPASIDLFEQKVIADMSMDEAAKVSNYSDVEWDRYLRCLRMCAEPIEGYTIYWDYDTRRYRILKGDKQIYLTGLLSDFGIEVRNFKNTFDKSSNSLKKTIDMILANRKSNSKNATET